MNLYLDTSDRFKNTVRLGDKSLETDDILGGIKKLLEARSAKPEDVEEIEAFPGPGSFTGLRIGCAIVNAMNYALGKLTDYGGLVFPFYGKEPNISQRKI